jgi:hypothetical protein
MPEPTTQSTTPSPELLFPAFLYGEKTPCRRKMKAEAKKWTKAYIAGREFPEPKPMPIAPGTVVFTDEGRADLVRLGYTFIPNTNRVFIDGDAAKAQELHLQWRLYLVGALKTDAMYTWQELMGQEMRGEVAFAFSRAFNAFVCKYPWGAISMAASPSFLSDIAIVVPRIEGCLRHWEVLDTLKYLGAHNHAISLAEHVLFYFNGEIAMWVDEPTGDVRADLRSAMEQMRQASADEIYTRLVKRLRQCADTDDSVKHRDWLKSPGVIEMGLKKELNYRQQHYDNLTSGQDSPLGGFLVLLERNYGPDADPSALAGEVKA